MPANDAVRRLGHSGVLRHLRRALACGFALALAGCGPGVILEQSPSRPASPTTYPDLASVPPRPVLADTQADRHAIQNQLLAARASADFRAAELAYATGRAAEPPPRPVAAAPAAAPAAARPGPPGGDGAIARAYLDSSLNDLRDRGKLRQFMRRLGREAPDPLGPQTLAQALGLASAPPKSGALEPQPATLDGFGDYLRGVFGVGHDLDDGPPL